MLGLAGWAVAGIGFPGLRHSWFGYSVVGAALSGSILLFQQYLVVTGRFVKLGWSRFTFAFAAIAAQTSLYWILPEKGLLLGYLFGLLANLVFLGREIRESFSRFPVWEPAKQAGRRYWPVVSYSLVSGLVGLLVSNFQPFLIAWAFDLQRAGFYFLAYRILGIPFNLIAGSISPVFIREMVHNLQTSSSKAYATAVRMATVLLGVFALISLLAVWLLPPVLDFIWGSKWSEVSAFTLWLIPLSIANGCLSAMGNLPEVLKKTRIDLIFVIALALYAAFSVLLGRFFEDFILFLAVFSFGTALLKGGILFYYLGVLKKHS
jgi:O-antigen/teichoic acid export membrane protein